MNHVPSDDKARKSVPLYTGLIKYFPDALYLVAELSRIGNDQHNPGQPVHWSKGKSANHLDSLMRHVLDAGGVDSDGVRHSTKVAWRALANLQTEIENVRSLGLQPSGQDPWTSINKALAQGKIGFAQDTSNMQRKDK